jgi:hypothetical protein
MRVPRLRALSGTAGQVRCQDSYGNEAAAGAPPRGGGVHPNGSFPASRSETIPRAGNCPLPYAGTPRSKEFGSISAVSVFGVKIEKKTALR